MSSSSSRPGIMSGSAKFNVIDGFPSCGPILPAIGTPTYKLAKLLLPMLEPLTTNEYNIRIPSTFQKNFKVLTLKLWWPALIQIHSIPTFLCKKQTSALKIYLKIWLMSKGCFCEFPPRTMSKSLILFDQEFHKQLQLQLMELQWVPH